MPFGQRPPLLEPYAWPREPLPSTSRPNHAWLDLQLLGEPAVRATGLLGNCSNLSTVLGSTAAANAGVQSVEEESEEEIGAWTL